MLRRWLPSGDEGEIKLEHLIVEPTQRRYGSPLLLIHDAWHAAWCWEQAMADFAARGFEVHAISLRSHGASDGPIINKCSLAGYVQDMRAALDVISPSPVMVGHGMGGYLVQYAISSGTPIVAAVLLCSMPPSGGNQFVVRWMRRHPIAGARGLMSANALSLVNSVALAREALFASSMPDDIVQSYLARLQPESAQVLTYMNRRPRPRPATTHMLVIGAEEDRLIDWDEQEQIAAYHRAELCMIPAAPHALMLDSSWPVAAATIEQWVQRIATSGE